MSEIASRLLRVLASVLSFGVNDVELQVIGAGLARTGTSSLQAALSTLYDGASVHHFENLVASSAQQTGWTSLRDPASFDAALLRSLVQGHVATVDAPSALHYRAMLKEFPKAKVVLTTHPKGPDGWYNSTMASIFHLHMDVLNKSWIGTYVQPFKGFHRVGRDVYLDNPYGLTREQWLQPEVAKRFYTRHNAEVRRVVPSSRLLVFSVDQGWGPLCRFLGKPVPPTPFPKINESAKLRMAAKVLWTIGIVLPILPFIIAFLRV